MIDSSKPYTFDRVVRMVLAAAVLVALFFLLRYLSDVLVPFAAAVALAYILNPLVTQIERRMKHRRGRAVAVTLIGLGFVVFSMVLLLALISLHQIDRFEQSLGRLRDDLIASMITEPDDTAVADAKVAGEIEPATSQPADESFDLGFAVFWNAWGDYLRDGGTMPRADRLLRLRKEVAGTVVGTLIDETESYLHSTDFRTAVVDLLRRLAVGGVTVINFVLELALAATVLVIVLLYLIFLLLDYPKYRRAWSTFIPPAYRENLVGFLAEFEAVLRRYFRGQIVIAAVTGIFFAIGFTIIGLPMAVPFGLFIGLLNIVPYLQMIALVPAAILAILRSVEHDSSLLASFGLVLLVFGVVQIIQDGLITPRIMGKATGLNPLAILLGMFIWGKLLGFLGLLLAIPLTCLGIAYYRRFVLQHSEEETSLMAEPG